MLKYIRLMGSFTVSDTLRKDKIQSNELVNLDTASIDSKSQVELFSHSIVDFIWRASI